MRVVREVEHTKCKITIFSWNLKYLIKLEKGPYEQTFKVSELDVTEAELDEILTDEFILEAVNRFDGMHASLQKHLI
jgi:hypothetical protein